MSERPKSKDMTAGESAMHKSGNVVQLSRRKADGTGWWLAGGGGLIDRALDGPDWMPLGFWLFELVAEVAAVEA
jgi:hypothetical protein